MKKIIVIIFLFLLSASIPHSIFALEKKPTATPTPKSIKDEGIEQIQKIKDIVASKVAELNLVEKRGFLGTVASTTTTQITIKDKNDIQRTIDIDELTKFDGDKDDTFGISDIESGDQLIFIGLYNKDTKHLLARNIKKSGNIPTSFSGIVSTIAEDEFQIVVTTEDNKKIKVDVEKSTKTSSIGEEGEITKSGFSKIKLHERVLVVGFDDPNNKETINASRILHFTTIPASVKMRIHAGIKDETTAKKNQ